MPGEDPPNSPGDSRPDETDWMRQARDAGWHPADDDGGEQPAPEDPAAVQEDGPAWPSPQPDMSAEGAPNTPQFVPEEASTSATEWPLVQPPVRKKTPVWVFALVGALVALWLSGAADEPLSKVGLNKNPCVKNAFGATFCGDDAERVCEQLGGPACAEAGFSDEGSLSDQLEDEPLYDPAADDSWTP